MIRQGQFAKMTFVLHRKTLTLFRLLYIHLLLTPLKFVQRNKAVSEIIQRKHLKQVLGNTFNYQKISGHSKIKIALILEKANTRPSSSAFIRLISPLTINEGYYYQITFFEPSNITLDSTFDVCIVQRAAFKTNGEVESFINQLDKYNVKLILDSDDSFHELDKDHPEHHIHSLRLDAFNTILARADEIWLSTSKLAQSYKDYSKKIHIIPNTLDPRLWESNKAITNTDTKVRYLYMGTATHDEDFKLVLPAFKALAKKHPKSFTLDVIGVSDSVKETSWLRILPQVRGSMYPDFVTWYLEQGPFDYGLSPLVDSAFNRSKSDIKCLDYLAAGIVPVVSDIEPYQDQELREFIIKVPDNSDSWFKTLESLVLNIQNDRQKNTKILAEANRYIQAKRNSTIAAQIIKERIEKLVSG